MVTWGSRSKTEKREIGVAIAALLIWTVLLTSVLSGAFAQGGGRQPEAQYTGGGPEACLSCHGGAQMTVIEETAHGDMSNPDSPYAQQGCESCHGPGSFHVSIARGGQGFPPLNDFSHVGLPVDGHFDTCLGCHAEASGDRVGIGWVSSLHDESGLTCSTCHVVHSNENPLADVALQRNMCAQCHGLQNPKHESLERSGMQIDTLKCSTCHNPHQL